MGTETTEAPPMSRGISVTEDGRVVDHDRPHFEAMPGETVPGYRPPPKIRGERAEWDRPEPPTEPPAFAFDTEKLLRLLAEADAAAAARQEASSRRRDARQRLASVRGEAARAAQMGQTIGRDLASRLRAAEQADAAAAAFYNETNQRTEATLATARSCREWAESRGWTEDGGTLARGWSGPTVSSGETF
jgi:hypothetical protein